MQYSQDRELYARNFKILIIIRIKGNGSYFRKAYCLICISIPTKIAKREKFMLH